MRKEDEFYSYMKEDKVADTVELQPGLYQLKLPIPLRSLGYVFVYFLRSGDKNLLIDTGWDSEESYVALKAGLDNIGVPISKLEKIVISHLHPDHFGLSARLKKEAPNATVIMHRNDSVSMRDSAEKFQLFLRRLHDWIRIQGAPEADINAMLDASSQMLRFVPPAHPDVELIGGEVLRIGDQWEMLVISTPGHTAGNICLYDRGGSRVLFSGDHILPTITPNVSFSPLYEGNPLGDYLHSLEQMKDLQVSIILPSHEHVFHNLKKRIEEIEQHHRDRLHDTVQALKGGQALSGYKVSSKLRWYSGSWEKLSAWEKRAALMETLAHLEYLKRGGKVAEIVESAEEGNQKVLYSLINEC